MNPQNLKPFVKGDPRINRKGPPRKLPNLDEILANVLGSEDKQGITEAEKIIEAMKKQAKKGNVRAAEYLADRSWGKPKQTFSGDMTADVSIKVEEKLFTPVMAQFIFPETFNQEIKESE